MYESPINIINDSIDDMVLTLEKNLEGEIVARARMELGIDIDRDGLISALNYDRGQYELGYEEGYKAGFSRAKAYFLKLVNDKIADEIEKVIINGEEAENDESREEEG